MLSMGRMVWVSCLSAPALIPLCHPIIFHILVPPTPGRAQSVELSWVNTSLKTVFCVLKELLVSLLGLTPHLPVS